MTRNAAYVRLSSSLRHPNDLYCRGNAAPRHTADVVHRPGYTESSLPTAGAPGPVLGLSQVRNETQKLPSLFSVGGGVRGEGKGDFGGSR